MVARREFLGALTTASILPHVLFAKTFASGAEANEENSGGLMEQILCGPQPAMPSETQFAGAPEAYWAELRKQFIFRPGFLYLNNGTMGSSPRPVLRAFIESILKEDQLESSEDTELYPLWGYGNWDEYRRPVANFVGAKLEEIALVRNATEGLNYVANGLDLARGDEVIYTDEEHGSGKSPWLEKQQRYGVMVREITLPKPPASKQQILDLFEAARTPRTRIVMASHITSATGCVLPAREICAWARAHNLLSFIDGAHAIGMIPLNLREMGCDFYVTSPHKWLLSPKGIGVLYVRDEVCDRLWNTMATGGWDDHASRAARFQQFGSSNVSVLAGLRAALDFWAAIGPQRIERRIRDLHAHVKSQVAQIPGAELVSAPGEEFTAGICTVNFPKLDRMKFQQWIYHTHRIRVRGTSATRLRLSTHIYHNTAELDRFVGILRDYLRGGAA
ncbi:MAG: aminotransferase class V-fold PLP-dependent enzyme [Acidipila sp.]|nr:aminotransferase class V-fold PLP-dependent enzyme [Acidipila sp.]